MVTAADVLIVGPELSSVPLEDISRFIADAYVECGNAVAWGAKQDIAVKYLAAHKVAVARGAAAEKDLADTRFGKEYLRLLKSLGLGFTTDVSQDWNTP